MRQKSALFVDFDNVYLSLRDEYDEKIADSFARNPRSFLAFLEWGGHLLATPSDALAADESTFGPAEIPALDADKSNRRDVLVRRVYLNPRGTLAQYAPNFTASGFSVIECPSLTQQGKSAADIHMTIDILDCLNHRTFFDDFIVLSADADFTPVLVRIRENNRLTSVYQSQNTSPAYLSNANHVINQDLIGMAIEQARVGRTRFNGTDDGYEFQAVRNVEDILETVGRQIARSISLQGPMEAGKIPRFFTNFPEFRNAEKRGMRWFGYRSLKELVRQIEQTDAGLKIVELEDDPQNWNLILDVDSEELLGRNREFKAKIFDAILTIVKSYEKPLPLSRLGLEIGTQLGPEPKETDWGGAGSLSTLIKEADSPEISLSDIGQGYVFNPAIHTIEMIEEQELPNRTKYSEALSSFIEEVGMLTNMPAIGPIEYAAMFEGIRVCIGEDGFPGILNLSKQVRDYCRDAEVRVARSHVNFILNQLTSNRFFLDKDSTEKDQLANAVLDRCLSLLERSNRRLNGNELELLKTMLCVSETENADADARQSNEFETDLKRGAQNDDSQVAIPGIGKPEPAADGECQERVS